MTIVANEFILYKWKIKELKHVLPFHPHSLQPCTCPQPELLHPGSSVSPCDSYTMEVPTCHQSPCSLYPPANLINTRK